MRFPGGSAKAEVERRRRNVEDQSDVDDEVVNVLSEILLAAQNIIGTLKAESATIVRVLVALKESNAAALKGQAVAGEAMKTEDMYGKAAQPAGLYKLLSQMRVGNPNWFSQIASATDAGLLRELVIMQAFQLELTRKNTDLLDRLTFIASLDYLTRMEGTTGKEMDDLYTRMVGAQQ